MTTPKLHRSVTAEILAWNTAELVRHILAGNWVAAVVNVAVQVDKLQDLGETMLSIASQEEPYSLYSSSEILEKMLVEKLTYHERFEAELGDRIREVIESAALPDE